MAGWGLWISTATSISGPAPSRTAAKLRGELVDARGDLQAVAGAEMRLEAAKAPLVDDDPRALGPGGGVRWGARARGGTARAVGKARLHAPGDAGAGGAVHAHAVAAGAAQELEDGHAVGLARQVPEGDVDAADGAHLDRAAHVTGPALVHELPKLFDAAGILAHEKRLQALHLGDDALGVVLQVRLAQAEELGIGVDFEPDPAWRHADDLETGDLHIQPPEALLRHPSER